MKKSCKECPYNNLSKHNEKFKTYVDNLTKDNKINGTHTCHMITHDILEKINENNICIGSKNKNK